MRRVLPPGLRATLREQYAAESTEELAAKANRQFEQLKVVKDDLELERQHNDQAGIAAVMHQALHHEERLALIGDELATRPDYDAESMLDF